MRACILLMWCASALAQSTGESPAALYQLRCAACHALNYNKLGPAHKGVLNRPIGKYPGFEYSSALRAATGIWTLNNLDQWLADPEQFLPGQHMRVSIPKPRERMLIIEHLKTL